MGRNYIVMGRNDHNEHQYMLIARIYMTFTSEKALRSKKYKHLFDDFDDNGMIQLNLIMSKYRIRHENLLTVS